MGARRLSIGRGGRAWRGGCGCLRMSAKEVRDMSGMISENYRERREDTDNDADGLEHTLVHPSNPGNLPDGEGPDERRDRVPVKREVELPVWFVLRCRDQ
jgi:hypothetical protein